RPGPILVHKRRQDKISLRHGRLAASGSKRRSRRDQPGGGNLSSPDRSRPHGQAGLPEPPAVRPLGEEGLASAVTSGRQRWQRKCQGLFNPSGETEQIRIAVWPTDQL